MARIYIALDDEITGLIEKLKDAADKEVVLVAPKGAMQLQSMVNIRLLQKKAAEFKKTLGVVVADPISRQLAIQAGVKVYHSAADVTEKEDVTAPSKSEPRVEEPDSDAPMTVKHYNASASEALLRHGQTEADKKPAPPEIDDEPKEDDAALEVETPEVEEQFEPAMNPSTAAEEPDTIVGRTVEEEEQTKRHRPTIKPARHLKFSLNAKLMVLLIIVLILGAVGVVVAAPQATVVLHVPAEALKKTVTLTVDPAIQSSNGTNIPAVNQSATVQATGTAKATGQKQVGDKAKGTITISNSWDSVAVSLPKDTTFVAAGNKLVFRSTSDTSVPGATIVLKSGQLVITPGKVDVAVVADQPGDQYNLSPTTFTISSFSGDKAAKITGANAAAMSGGTSKTLTVVADKDIDQAKADAKTKLEAAAGDELKKTVKDNEIFLQQTTTNLSYGAPNHQAGDQVDTVEVSVSGSASGVGCKVADVESALKTSFQDMVKPNRSVILPDISSIKWDVKAGSSQTLLISSEVEGNEIANIDQAAVQKAVMGKRPQTVADIVKDQFQATSSEVTLIPSKWWLMPLLPNRITVKTEQ